MTCCSVNISKRLTINIDGLIKKKKTYQQLIVLGNGHSGVLLFNWKFPRVM